MHLSLMVRSLTSFSVKPKMTSSLALEDILTNLLMLKVCRMGSSLSEGQARRSLGSRYGYALLIHRDLIWLIEVLHIG